jgi:Transglutaminase-like superfamily
MSGETAASGSDVLHRAKHRAGVLVGFLMHPSDGLLAGRMLAWRLVLPVLKRFLALRRLAALMWSEHGGHVRPDRSERVVELADLVYRSGHHPPRDNCLDRGLVLYRYLSAIGVHPRLVVGMRREGDEVRGHVWVTRDGTPLGDYEMSLESFTRVTAFGDRGTPLS